MDQQQFTTADGSRLHITSRRTVNGVPYLYTSADGAEWVPTDDPSVLRLKDEAVEVEAVSSIAPTKKTRKSGKAKSSPPASSGPPAEVNEQPEAEQPEEGDGDAPPEGSEEQPEGEEAPSDTEPPEDTPPA